MKGVSAIIATILMLIITIGLAGTAYMYISGVLTTRTAVTLSVSDAVCSGTAAGDTIDVVTVNDGTNTATAGTITITVNGVDLCVEVDVPARSAATHRCTAAAAGDFVAGINNILVVYTGGSTRGVSYC